MTEFSWRTRSATLDQFSQDVFDVLIIGGGITGAGLALDAASRGLRTALVEKRDFAAGTSSRTTKLIHGGLRYLEQFDFGLVREALHERAILARTAPHLAEAYPFVIPIYANKKRNYDHPLKMRAGLFLYDLLAGRYNFARHRRLSREEALELAPQLDPQGLQGAFLYYDARTNDARLVIEALKAAHAHGARIANYASVQGFLRDAAGKVTGARLRDEVHGRELEIHAHTVINATGVWMEDLVNLSGQRSLKTVRPAKGIHLTVSADRLRVNSAWLIPSLTGHRFYFVVPWEGRINIGTTDTDFQGDKDTPRANAEEVNEILGAINSYFPGVHLGHEDVISSWAGLRPLISDPNAKNTSQVSRKEEMLENADGLISISGGKLTTYRLMAERGVDLAAQRLQERFGVSAGPGRTRELKLGGGEFDREQLAQLAEQIARTENLPLPTAQHLVFSYGSEAEQVLELLRADERWRRPLVPGLPHLAAELIYIARNEMAVTLTDVLTRRTRLAMLAGNAIVQNASHTAALLASEMEWDETATERQVAAFREEFAHEYRTE